MCLMYKHGFIAKAKFNLLSRINFDVKPQLLSFAQSKHHVTKANVKGSYPPFA